MPAPSQPSASEYAEYYGNYTKLVPEGDILEILVGQMAETQDLLNGISEAQASTSYAPGKWTIKEVVGHLVDMERVFALRSLVFARGDESAWPGVEQDDYVRMGNFNQRLLRDIAEEFAAVRHSNVLLYRSFDEEIWQRKGIASDCPFSVRSIPYILAGHELHHCNVLRQRYL